MSLFDGVVNYRTGHIESSSVRLFQELVAHPSFNISILHQFHLAPPIALFQKQYRNPLLKRLSNRWKFYAWSASNVQCGLCHLIALPLFFFAPQHPGADMLQRKCRARIPLPIGSNIVMPHHVLEAVVPNK